MSLQKYKEINLSRNKFVLLFLNLFGLGLLFISLPLFSKLAGFIMELRLGVVPEKVVFTITVEEILFFLLAIVATSLIHELIHGLFFKVFAPDRPVKYDFHWYALSASSPGTKYSKGKFIWIGMAPFVLITFTLTLLLDG